jgi:small-conductance mechanosensitive channel
MFLVIIYFITKYVLQLIKLFFSGLESGGIILKDFRPEWAVSTFKIVRTFIIVFAVVLAYPYIPGSDSVAFKGISVFMGILFSIGSSGFIGNLIAGYSMIYRGAFRIGDYIEVEGQTGFVEVQELLVTRLRSLKNEEIILPNSILLNSKIINYTVKAQETGVILHTVVGIGYETPWRQVDAMLKLAASRTEGLLTDPPPFVQKLLLADYAVNYEINAYCKDINRMKTVYTLLHQNILDVFNENNVQIMTPSYVADTEIPKMVPQDQWNTPLAKEK